MQSPIQKFNGGKLYHINKTTSGNRPGNRPGSLVYTDEFISDKAEEALHEGEKQLKVHGECSALHRENGKWVFYRRQDNYKGNGTTCKLASGAQPAQYNQGTKEHNYCWLKIDDSLVTGKGKRRSSPGPDTYAAIANAVGSGLLPDPTDENEPEWITCEWVGIKHQSNMDGITDHHALIPHMSPFVPQLHFKTLEEFVSLVSENCFEGAVIIHPDGTRFKVRSDMTGIENDWVKNYRKKAIDPGVTTIRPQVLTKDGMIRWIDGKWVLVANLE